MVFVYIRIYFAAKRRARRGIKKVPKKPIAPSEQVSEPASSINYSTPSRLNRNLFANPLPISAAGNEFLDVASSVQGNTSNALSA